MPKCTDACLKSHWRIRRLGKRDNTKLKDKLSGPLYIPSALIHRFGGYKAYIAKQQP